MPSGIVVLACLIAARTSSIFISLFRSSLWAAEKEGEIDLDHIFWPAQCISGLIEMGKVMEVTQLCKTP